MLENKIHVLYDIDRKKIVHRSKNIQRRAELDAYCISVEYIKLNIFVMRDSKDTYVVYFLNKNVYYES